VVPDPGRNAGVAPDRHQNDEGEWASLLTDLIIVSDRTDGTLATSIIDPHGDYRADARAKLQALPAFPSVRCRFRADRIGGPKSEDGSLAGAKDLADPA